MTAVCIATDFYEVVFCSIAIKYELRKTAKLNKACKVYIIRIPYLLKNKFYKKI